MSGFKLFIDGKEIKGVSSLSISNEPDDGELHTILEKSHCAQFYFLNNWTVQKKSKGDIEGWYWEGHLGKEFWVEGKWNRPVEVHIDMMILYRSTI